ncbi:MAG TPA: primosomal protein N' [Phycisphaerales bacterium]|nr:primosomal protein N' [Phycisphaerales bacterium]
MAGLFDEPTISYVQVAVERAVDRYPNGLTYGVPELLAPIEAGQLVTVPLGRGNTPTEAWVLSTSDNPPTPSDTKETKQIISKNAETVSLPNDLVSLASWISSYYCSAIGPTLSTMLPGPVRKGTGLKTKTLLDVATSPPLDTKITKKQEHVLACITALPKNERPIGVAHLMKIASLGSRGPIDRLCKHGFLSTHQVTHVEAAWFKRTIDNKEAPTLTDDQQIVFDAISPTLSNGYSCHLLHGVTGSGKTEMYIRLIDHAIKDGGKAIVLVPEISLTPQTAARLMGRFPNKQVAILHSALTKAQRHQQWAMAASGEADIILGARSAVFAPVPIDDLKIIIVDEEHDHSYKQDQTPRYHGRDVAIRRASSAKCPIVLGSATPSMESWWNATRRNISTLHTLPRRAPGLTSPTIEIVNMRIARAAAKGVIPVFSRELEHEIQRSLATGGQILLLLNRRGFAPWIACSSRGCDWMMRCEHCESSMVYHRRKPLEEVGFVRCHHCAKEQRVPKSCPDCSKPVIRLGAGTQKLEAIIRETIPLPDDQIARLDTDTARKSSDLHSTLDRFTRGEIRVLLGTQMIAKGLDVAGVTLVGVIDADTAIDLPDFRASERTYQLVAQVCGRCGRGSGNAKAIVQTYNPEAPAIVLAAQNKYEEFASRELQLRQETGLPPSTRMVRFVIRDDTFEVTAGRANALYERLMSIVPPAIQLTAAAPCVLTRIADRYRFDLTASAPTARELQHFLGDARGRQYITNNRDLAVDVDPVSML